MRIFFSLVMLALLAGCATITPPASPAAATNSAPVSTVDSATLPAAADNAQMLDSPRTFTLAGEESEVSYKATEEFFGRAVRVHGPYTVPTAATRAISGAFVVDLASGAPVIVDGAVEVDLRTLVSDREERDQRVRERYLESDSFPFARFVPTAVRNFVLDETGTGGSFTLDGEMTVREQSMPVSFDVTAALDGSRLSGIATTALLMSDFGVTPPDMAGFVRVQDEIEIAVEFVALPE